jgi:hypothetical protein
VVLVVFGIALGLNEWFHQNILPATQPPAQHDVFRVPPAPPTPQPVDRNGQPLDLTHTDHNQLKERVGEEPTVGKTDITEKTASHEISSRVEAEAAEKERIKRMNYRQATRRSVSYITMTKQLLKSGKAGAPEAKWMQRVIEELPDTELATQAAVLLKQIPQ